MTKTTDAMIDLMLANSGERPSALIGPVIRLPDGNHGEFYKAVPHAIGLASLPSLNWYFVVALSDKDKDSGFFVTQIVCDKSWSKSIDQRRDFILGLISRPPMVVHDMDDELEMARLAETIWPGERTAKIRAALEAERVSA